MADAWPAAPDEGEYSRVRTSNVETLVIGGELDFSTPPQVATKELLPYLPNGHEVVLPGFGHTPSFLAEQPEASSRLINTFFDSGRVDDSLYKPQKVDFTPEVTHTALAKVFAGTMVGLALLAVLSLLWMARRVRKRGHFGRKASATLRSLYPIVLGLGGWFLGALIVMTTMPGVPLDNELLAVLSVGVPVGLGIYFAWVHRDWSAASKARASRRQPQARSSAPGWGSTPRWPAGARHRDRRGRRRRQPHADPPRHRPGSAAWSLSPERLPQSPIRRAPLDWLKVRCRR